MQYVCVYLLDKTMVKLELNSCIIGVVVKMLINLNSRDLRSMLHLAGLGAVGFVLLRVTIKQVCCDVLVQH